MVEFKVELNENVGDKIEIYLSFKSKSEEDKISINHQFLLKLEKKYDILMKKYYNNEISYPILVLKKDLDLGLQAARELGVSMPVSAATREALQNHFGAASLKSNSEEYLDKDFSALLETVALNAGVKLEPENKDIKTGLETEIGTSN